MLGMWSLMEFYINYKSVIGLKSTSPEGFFAQELSQVQLSLEGIQIVSAGFFGQKSLNMILYISTAIF